MLEIKKFQHKHKCDAKKCKNLNVYSLGPKGENNAFKQFYCEEHLKEMVPLIIGFFDMDIAKLSDSEHETMEQLKKTIQELQDSLDNSKSNALPAVQDLEEIKAENKSLKATNKLLIENNDKLKSENDKLKNALSKSKKPKKPKK